MKNNEKIKCAIIGVGWWGTQMSRFIKRSKMFNIKTIYDVDATKVKSASRRLKCDIASSLEIVLGDDEIKCVFIFSPNEFHAEHAIKAAEAKKHIFLEKPIANTVLESKKIVEACKKNGVILAIGHNVRYYGIFKEAKKIIKDKTIGDIVYVDGNRSRPIGYKIDKKSWRFYSDKCNGGPLIQMAIHLIDAVNFICGLGVEEIKKISLKKILKTENDESFGVLIKFNKNKIFHIFSSYVIQESFYLNFFGTEGTLRVDVFNGLSLQKNRQIKFKKLNYLKNHPEIEELALFYDSINNSKQFNNPTAEDALKNVDLVERILLSS